MTDEPNIDSTPTTTQPAADAGIPASPKRPAVRFVVVFVVLVSLFYVPYAYVSQTDAYKSTYLSLVAKCTSGVLCVLGQDTTAVGTFIRSPRLEKSPTLTTRTMPSYSKPTNRKGKGKLPKSERVAMKRAAMKRAPNRVEEKPESRKIAFDIVPGCDGTEGFALLGSAVLASPFVLRARLVFLLIGTVVLFVVNVLRIATLFMLGLYFPDVFHSAHMDLWPGFIIVTVLVCWLSWARWMMRRQGGIPVERG